MFCVFFCFQDFVEIVLSSSKTIPLSCTSGVVTSLVKPSLTSQSWISYSSPALKLFVVGITLYYKQPVCPCSSNETTSNLRTGTAYSPAQCLLCY